MKLFVQAAAEQDIIREIQRFADLGASEAGYRFHESIVAGIEAVLTRPLAGSPKSIKNPQLAGLRSWPVKGFDAFRIYYLIDDDRITVVRILHGKRDIARIFDEERSQNDANKK